VLVGIEVGAGVCVMLDGYVRKTNKKINRLEENADGEWGMRYHFGVLDHFAGLGVAHLMFIGYRLIV
jgi:hypothetical protein